MATSANATPGKRRRHPSVHGSLPRPRTRRPEPQPKAQTPAGHLDYSAEDPVGTRGRRPASPRSFPQRRARREDLHGQVLNEELFLQKLSLPARFPLASPHSARVDPETPPRLPPLAQ